MDSHPVSPPLNPAERAIAERLHRHVDMLAGIIGSRHMGRPSTIAAATAYIQRELESPGEAVRREGYEVGGQTAENMVLERRGSRRPEQIVLLGAHYDSVFSTPGADDNASAVAVLIEAVRLLRGKSTPRTVRFIAFANEEPPYFYTGDMGSQVYARQCRQRKEQIVGMICLEMVGYFDTSPGSQKYPPGIPRALTRWLPTRGDFIGMVSNIRSARLLWRARRGFRKAVRFPLVALPLPERISDIRRSDHGPFWDENFPALMVTDTSFFRNPNYHLASDTVETLDYERMARVTIGVAGATACVAGGGSARIKR